MPLYILKVDLLNLKRSAYL